MDTNLNLTKGLIQGFLRMPDEQYFKVRCFSNSLAKILHAQSELHALAWMNDETPVSKTKQYNFDFGTAAHLMVFQPAELEKRIVQDNPANKNSKIYKEWRETVPEDALVLSSADMDKLYDMRYALTRKRSVMDILQAEGYAERAGFFRDPSTEAWVKMKPDWIFHSRDGFMAIADYKTCRPDALADFDRQVGNLNYHFQSFLYTWGAEVITGISHPEFYWICQEKEPPYDCRVFVADPSMIAKAKEEVRGALDRWAQCIETGVFEGYPDVINYAYLPAWRMGINN